MKEILIVTRNQYEGISLFVLHAPHFLSSLSNRVLELTLEGVHQFDGGCSEYVARAGQEAPGLLDEHGAT